MADVTGRVLGGRYRVEAFLGQGGMADVYKVWDQQRAAFLAMKMLHDDLAEDEVFLRRFEREAHTLELLQHPNIVRCYGLEKADTLAFILMDYIDGLTLRKEIFLNKGGLPPERVLEMMRPVCAALYYAHQMGMAHCDIKPANIMLHRNGTVYLTDFGIARMTEASTQTMMEMGTPAYMAPEQLDGQEPTPASDIYAVGVVLYEMVSGGHRPFTGAAAHTSGSTTRRIIWEKNHLAPPSPGKYRPDLSPELESVILRCLERKPERRYRTALELLEALERAILGGGNETLTLANLETPSGKEPSPLPLTAVESRAVPPARMRPFYRRVRLAWWAAAAAALALAVIGLSLAANNVNAPGAVDTPLGVALSGANAGMTVTLPAHPASRTPTAPSLLIATPTAAAPAAPATPAAPAATVTPLPSPTPLGGSGHVAYAWDSGDGKLEVWVMDIANPRDHQQITDEPAGACQPAWSPDGSAIAYTTPCRGPSVYYPGSTIKIIRLADHQVQSLPLNNDGTSGSFDPAWSPDGQTLAFTAIVGERTEVHAITLADQKTRVLANRGTKSAQPAWSPDGAHIAFVTTDTHDLHVDALWLMDKDGGSQEVFSTAGAFSEPAWSPDGNQILVSINQGNNIPVLALFDRAHPALGPKLLLPGDALLMSHGAISPDGKWVVFWSDRQPTTRSREIFLAGMDGQSLRQVTDNTLQDFQPAWSPR